LLGAIGFLTILKTPGANVPPGRAAAYFPLIGAGIGAAGGVLFLLASRALPLSIAALITVAFWTIISGVLHEDGLADVADAMRAGRTRERMLAILKDSRVGTFGAVALILSIAARWQAVEHLATPAIVVVCLMAHAVSRAAMVTLAWISRPSGEGLGAAFSSTLTTGPAVAAIVQGVAAAFLLGWRPGLTIVLGAYFIIRGARAYFYRRIGGVNGDCLGATEQLVEIFILVLFTCNACIS
jgi:adenosylcobinamide-GDP ribazoletransferase